MSNLEQIVKILQEANQELKEDNDKAEGKTIIVGKEVDEVVCKKIINTACCKY
jgi:hypothetical protein